MEELAVRIIKQGIIKNNIKLLTKHIIKWYIINAFQLGSTLVELNLKNIFDTLGFVFIERRKYANNKSIGKEKSSKEN